MNFCPHEFGQKLDVLATISLVFGKQGFVWLGDDRRATVADTWLFFFFFSGFSFPPREGGETGRLMKIVTANRRGWWKWEAMRWTVINAMLSWKGREEGVENCILLIRDFGFPMLFIVIRGKCEISFETLENKNFFAWEKFSIRISMERRTLGIMSCKGL